MRQTLTANPVSYLRSELERYQALFLSQDPIVQRFIESQAQRLAQAITSGEPQVQFMLPDRVMDRIPHSGEVAGMLVPVEVRKQTIGGLLYHFQARGLLEELRKQLSSLEQSTDQSIHTSARLLRYATAIHLVHNMLPAGRTVLYAREGDEEIPSLPVKADGDPESAITTLQDAIVESNPAEDGRGSLQTPFVPAARLFYLPQWVSFDEKGNLLVNSEAQADAQLASMLRYIDLLHAASSLAVYILADEEYQRKRYGILGQAINQGRALARYKTKQIISTIQQRVSNGTLNRGLSINLHYFDDQNLCMAHTQLEIIPAGRITFKSVFVVRAVRLEHAKVLQDTRLNISTRAHLLGELEMLEQAFINFQEQVVI